MNKNHRLFFYFIILFASTAGFGQMRQVYTDTDENNHIRNISFYSLSEGYVAFSKWIGFTQDSGRTFIKKFITTSNVNYNNESVNLTFGFSINGVHAFSKDRILVYGHYGFRPAILYSSDRGNSFSLVYHFSLNQAYFYNGVTDMEFPNEGTTGYAIVEDQVIKTADKGLSWHPVFTGVGLDLFKLDFQSGVLGYVLGSKSLIKTQDGGGAWQFLPKPAGDLLSINFINEQSGWLNVVNDNGGLIYGTTDGGTSWVLKNEVSYYDVRSTVMHFINDSTGYAIAPDFDLLKTSDKGKIWEKVERDNNFRYLNYSLQALHFINVNTLWAGGGHGFLEFSTNGGGITMPKALLSIDLSQLSTISKIQLINKSKQGYSYKWFKNSVLLSTDYTTSYTSNRLSIDTIKLIVLKGTYTDTAQAIIDTRVNTAPCSATFVSKVDTASVLVIPNDSSYGVKHYWYFGDGNIDSTNKNAKHSYNQVGQYKLLHVVFNTITGCKDSTFQLVDIIRMQNCLVPDFTFIANTFYTNKLTFTGTYSTTTEAGASPMYTVDWNWGDGSSNVTTYKIIDHSFDSARTYNVCYTVRNNYTGCISSTCKPVLVQMATGCDADFTMDAGATTFTSKPQATTKGKRNTWIINDRAPVITGNDFNYSTSFFVNQWGEGNRFGGCSTWSSEICIDSLNRTIKHIVYDSISGCTAQVEKNFQVPRRMNLIIKAVPDLTDPYRVTFYAYQVYGRDSIPYPSYWRLQGPGQNMYSGGFSGYYHLLTVTFSKSGLYTVAIAANTCSEVQEVYFINYNVAIDPCYIPPFDFVTTFNTDANAVLFNTGLNASTMKNRSYNFGDGDSAVIDETLVLHAYKSPGIFNVNLKYETVGGCIKEVSKQIEVQIPCGATIMIPSNIAGLTYNWEVDKGNGWQGISSDANYDLRDNRNLTINSIPASFLGYKYRCYVTTNFYGPQIVGQFTLRLTNTWLGTKSTVWEDPANWSCGVVPSVYTSVVINSGAPNMPTINSNVRVFGLIINPGMTLNINPGFTITVMP